MKLAWSGIQGVCDVEVVRGASAPPDARPGALLEIAHGATRAADFDDLAAALHGSFPEGLREFFFVNTDVGAPELARAVAGLLVTARPECAVALVRCRIPRTFLDCNRRIARDTVARASAAGEMTPGLQPWVRDARDRELLLERYFAYRELVSSAFAEVLALGGVTTFVHTYAPRSIDVAVDDEIARRLREAYAPGRIETWPLRSQVDLITADPEGVELAQRELAEGAEHEFEAAGFEVSRNTAYPLHPVTLAHELTSQRPASALCLEVRRDLLVPEFVPFVELATDPAKVARAAAPLARALAPFVAAR